ncbi:hypothetical protein GGF43_005263, partial [Coemansia sp. RSA 2618]
ACFSALALVALAGTQLASAAPVVDADAVGIQYVPRQVDWNAVDWSKVNWNAINWQSVFSSAQQPAAQNTAVQQAAPASTPAAVEITPAAAAPSPVAAAVSSVVAPVEAAVTSVAATVVKPVAAVVTPAEAAVNSAIAAVSSAIAAATTPDEDTYTSAAVETLPAANTPSTPSSGSLWGLTYSPYNTDGSCPDVGSVTSQLQKISALTGNIRLYSTDCSQMRNALQAISSSNINMGIHAGIWITDGASRMQSDLDEFVAAAKQYDSSLIKGVSVGNEDISKGMSEATLIGYINQVRSRLQSEGLGHIPVYTTEQDAHFTSAIAAACDLVQVNIYSIFDSIFTSVDASVQSVIQRADNIKKNVAGGKPVRFGETGWASGGSTGASPLSLANEIAYVQKFKCAAATAGYDYFYFEAKDALWKQGQAQSEQSFGLFSSNFVQKFDFGLLNLC